MNHFNPIHTLAHYVFEMAVNINSSIHLFPPLGSRYSAQPVLNPPSLLGMREKVSQQVADYSFVNFNL
jgi:hypothetical protein